VSPQPIGFHSNIACTAMPGPLENGVFDEVADAVELSGFVPGSTAYPDSGGHRPEPRHMLGQDGYAIREFSRLNVVNHLPGTKLRWKPKPKAITCTAAVQGGLNPSTLQNGAANDPIYRLSS